MDGKCGSGDDPQASERPIRRRRTEFLKLRRLRHTGKIAGQNSGRTGHAKDGTLNTKVGRPRASWLSAVGPRFGPKSSSIGRGCIICLALLGLTGDPKRLRIGVPPFKSDPPAPRRRP